MIDTMTMADNGKLIVGLDIGTSKVVAIVGALNGSGNIEVTGIGSHISRGLRRGAVVNIDETVNAITHAINEAELMAGCRIHSVYAGIAGSHVSGYNSSGTAAIQRRIVSSKDVEQVLESAKAYMIPAENRILHTIPQEYSIDGQKNIAKPLGMTGVRLEAQVHLVTCNINAAENIENCIRQCGLEVDGLVLEQLASSHAVLTEDELQRGVCMVDIGAGTTDIAIYVNGAIRHTAVIRAAGVQVTNDIAIVLNIPTESAEELKIKYGSAMKELASEGSAAIPFVDEHVECQEVSLHKMAAIIEARYRELFELTYQEIQDSGYNLMIPAGIVLTGGSSKIEGAVELARKVFQMPTRLGVPSSDNNLSDLVKNPIYSTGVGLVHYGQKHPVDYHYNESSSESQGFFSRFKNYFRSNF